MIKVKYKATGEIKEVTRNEAHGLLEMGLVEIVKNEYKTVVMTAKKSKYKIK